MPFVLTFVHFLFLNQSQINGLDHLLGLIKINLELEYNDVLARKFDKKIRDLEYERQKLKQSEQKYKRIVESLRREYFFYSQDENGVFTYISPSVELILGSAQK
ncbi:hypothetical protein [uncultured Desulfobacter sp.]|uniref:hypothetical protein n=1 Tax=uncultured Desulfobacter sp. TaxID=240139 RepID=UPI002AABDB28|nr:hypothetical protein [uncultured Desulfobacter sp.]